MPNALIQLKAIWGRLKAGQRISIVGAAVATLALMGALVFYGSQPEFGVLFSDLKPEDAQGVVEKLKAANVPYKLTGGGTVISVPTERVPELRLEMASSGALSGGHVGFDLFDKTSFGATDFTQQVNYRRAIEGELSRTLEGMDELESVRVHITQPRESIFAEKAERAKASVMVRVHQGRELSRERVESVVSLVASAVEGLDPGDVAVMDTRGRLLSAAGRDDGGGGPGGGSGAFNAQLEARRKLEAETAGRIVTLLEPISGAGHVRADVATELDFSRVEQTEEKYDPKSAVIRSQQTSQEARSASGSGPANIAGARANDPSVLLPPVKAASPTTTGDQRTAATTNYEIDKTIKHTTGGSGRLTRMSVSVVVDYKMVSGVATTRTPDELRKMQDLVAAAVGVDAARGDQIVVQSIPFDQPTIETRTQSWLESNRELVNLSIKYGALVVAVLLLLVFIIRPARRTLRLASASPQIQLSPANRQGDLNHEAGRIEAGLSPDAPAINGVLSGQQAQLATPRTVAELEAEMDAEVAREISASVPDLKRANAVKKQIFERGKNDPETVAMTLRGWLQESPPRQ